MGDSHTLFYKEQVCNHWQALGVCSSAGRAAVSKAAGRGFESLRTRILAKRGSRAKSKY